MSKTLLVERLADKMGTKADAERAVDAVTKEIMAMVEDGEQVVLRGFGTFKKSVRKARTGRNIATGEPIEIAESRKMTFKSNVKL
jgi:DNA-binding protein HU-beta